jgi:predicted phosphoadenosine phosphosulfate sulfurtransferase
MDEFYGKKQYLQTDVMTAARERIRKTIAGFPRFYVSVSGGKDSSALVQLVIEEARKQNRLPVPILIVDLEAQYRHTVEFLERICARTDEVQPYWICLPIHLRNGVSQIQTHWLCWDDRVKNLWVRDFPDHVGVIKDPLFLPFFRAGMEFEEFTPLFGDWFADGIPTACFVGIRADESINRFRTIKRQDKRLWNNEPWTTWISDTVCNTYPLYDWRTEDVWIAHGRQKWDYNRVYDLMHLAGLSIHQMRLCQPYGDDQRKGLWLFKILEPETWSKVVNRVQGANFGNRYVELTGNVFGNIKISLPEGHTWKSYAKFLLATMPEPTAIHYRRKIWTFLRWWRKHRKEFNLTHIPDFVDPRIEAKRSLPSWRRICKTLLKNDYWCKTLSFSQTKREMERQLAVITKYMEQL